jgi:hypothetical protein
MTKSQALYQFMSSFGLNAFLEGTVPNLTTFPYLTYIEESDSIDYDCMVVANLWYRSTSWKDALDKANEIAKRVKEHGFITIPFDNGYLYVKGGHPFYQAMDDPDDDMIKRVYINLTIEYLSSY